MPGPGRVRQLQFQERRKLNYWDTSLLHFFGFDMQLNLKGVLFVALSKL
jgi:hypothetical protein